MMRFIAIAAAITLGAPALGIAQAAPDQATPKAATEVVQEQDSLKVHFRSGSATVSADEQATLDQAARLFREGSPIVMVVAGGADTVGNPDANLALSVRRAEAVLDGLVARGIPAERLQLLGRGTSELVVDTAPGVDNPDNRVVEITWR